jgi:hypothetical protein
MDWSAFALKQSAENLKKIKKLQKECLHLSDAVFQVDLFLKPDISAQVIAYLAEHYELNTQRGYNVALNNCYVQLGQPSPYAQRITEINAECAELKKGLDTTVSPADYQHCTAIVDRVISGDQAGVLLGIKVMCALLKYRIDVSLAEMIAATFTPSANQYNTDTWIIDGKIVPLSKAFQDYTGTLRTDREYLVVKPSGQKYDQIKSLSKSFDLLFGKSYLKVKHILWHPPSAATGIPVAAPAKLKLVLKVKVQPPLAEEAEPPKKKLKLKVGLKVGLKTAPTGRAWEFYKDPALKAVSNAKHLAHVQRLTGYMCGLTDQFYYSAFAQPEAYDKVIRFLTEDKVDKFGKTFCYSKETQRSYINALCKFLSLTEDYTSDQYARYCDYAYQTKTEAVTLAAVKRSTGSTVIDFTALTPLLQNVVQDKQRVKGFRVLCSMIVNNLNLADTEDDELGVLRMSDVQNTRFIDDGVHSHINLDTKVWTIVVKPRTIALPDKFVADIKAIYGLLPAWLLVDKQGLPYTNMASLSNMFQRYLGQKFSAIRASYLLHAGLKK